MPLYKDQTFTVSEDDTLWVLTHRQYVTALKKALRLQIADSIIVTIDEANDILRQMVVDRDSLYDALSRELESENSELAARFEKARRDLKELESIVSMKEKQLARYRNLFSDEAALQTIALGSDRGRTDIIIAVIGALATIAAAFLGYRAARYKGRKEG